MINLQETFETHSDKSHDFQNVKGKLHHRPDICAFILLDTLLPDENKDQDMVSAAQHDQIYLNVDCEKLAAVATEEDIITLIQCGVFYESSTDSLSMFV